MTKKVRNIIKIDEEKCDGCGQCVLACEEGALEIHEGKAKVVKESFCDGLGACIGECPRGALTIEQREVDDFDEEAVKKHLETHKPHLEDMSDECNCPSIAFESLEGKESGTGSMEIKSELRQWPVKFELIPPGAPYLKNADLAIIADCVAYAYGGTHPDFIKRRVIITGCPKLGDKSAFVQKLASIFKTAQPRSIEIVIMEVPCCGGLKIVVEHAMKAAGLNLPLKETMIGIKGDILSKQHYFLKNK